MELLIAIMVRMKKNKIYSIKRFLFPLCHHTKGAKSS